MGTGQLRASPVLLLFLLGYCLAVIDGELRCYCNESGCVSTGYMCKSAIGSCFTSIDAGPLNGGDSGDDVIVPHRTHGCLDTIPPRHRVTCMSTGPQQRVASNVNNVNVLASSDHSQEHHGSLSSAGASLGIGGGDVAAASASSSSESTESSRSLQNLPLLMCCSEHMCNYVEDTAAPDATSLNRPGHKKTNGTLFHDTPYSKKDNAVSRDQGSSRDDDRELWFKAAVIAVPIAGGFILVLLVLLAVRMLRTDSRHHRRLIQIRQDRNFTKTQMYISDHFVGKKHQCSLFNEKTGKICSILYPPESSTSTSTGVSSTKPAGPKPIYTSTSHKNPSHRHTYIGLVGESIIYDKRKKRLKDTGGSSVASTTHYYAPPSAIQSSCDNFSSSFSSSKNSVISECCKEHCGNKTNSNRSINNCNIKICPCSDNRCSVSSQDSLHSKGGKECSENHD